MTSEQASLKKRKGHDLERKFATLIGGEVKQKNPQGKTDVFDKQNNCHSVKGGYWWQMFLYSRRRLIENTEFQELKNITQCMIDCIDAFPEGRDNYVQNKHAYKIKLQKPMRLLAEELQKEESFQKFLRKCLFNSDEVHYLSVFRKIDRKFYVFWHQDVINTLENNLQIINSEARTEGQYDCQKVLFKYGTNVSEIEVRTDSNVHYKQMKCRFNAEKITHLLASDISTFEERYGLYLYGKAIENFHV